MRQVNVGEPWLAVTSCEWPASRIRNVAQLSPGYSDIPPAPDEMVTVVPMERLSESGIIDVSAVQDYAEIKTGLTPFEEGDVLFAKITPCMENGKDAYVKGLPTRYAFGSTEFHVLRPYHDVNPRFLYYYTFNPAFRAYAAENMSDAAGQKRVSSRFLKDTRLFLPPLQEQERIAAYLDASCAAIDAAVTAKHRQIETLSDLRKSIVEAVISNGLETGTCKRRIDQDWLGAIPAHWDALRIKRIVSRVDYGISQRTIEEGRFPVLKMGHIDAGEILLTNFDYVDEVAEELLLETGDLLYNRTNSPDLIGKAAVFRGEASDEITFASYLVRLRVNHRADPFYLNLVLNSEGFLSYARKLAIPSVQQSNLNSTRYGRMLVPLPPVEEQQKIVAYLDDKISEIRCIASTICAQIDTLIAYRKSMIHECVTGQRRVSEDDVCAIRAKAGALVGAEVDHA